MVDVKCSVCGIDFKKYNCHLRYKHIVCSRKCYGELRKKIIGEKKIKTCPQCKKEFITGGRDKRHHTVIYCSRPCFDIHRQRRRSEPCLKCGVIVTKPISHFKKKTFCSKYCAYSYRVRKFKPVPSCYKLKRVVMIETIGQCQRCGYKKYPNILHIHHKDRNRKNNEDSNLELICPNCHEIEHRGTRS